RLAFMWLSCFFAFAIAAFILARQSYKNYQEREEVERYRKEMTNALAHDLKTPLSIVSGYAQNLIENVQTEKREHYAANIQANVERMDRIVQEMLDLSRLEANSFQIKFGEVSLSEVCGKIISRYKEIWQEKSIKTHLEGDAIIKADPVLMEKVIDNFFVNALDNTPNGGRISIRISETILEFYNSGSYIPEEKIKDIWEPYQKVDPSRNTKGTGLGLAIARTILEMHGFSHGAKNSGEGVIFWFKFA
ncbi:MAG TPA: HAMP domain-containing histidine kinase, partial [Clostridia bacterium]|nr:HAMP domain-containing histidine kinase [Clostridia bacterium]